MRFLSPDDPPILLYGIYLQTYRKTAEGGITGTKWDGFLFFDSTEKKSKEITELVSLSSLLPPSQLAFQSYHSLFKPVSVSAGTLCTAGACREQLCA